MRILILGGTGMLGHALWQHFSVRVPGTYTTIRRRPAGYEGLFAGDRVIDSLDLTDFAALSGVLRCVKPTYILNCTGVTKRHIDAESTVGAITLNALFPHQLERWCRDNGGRVLNFSTDCVFDGELGDYTDESPTNATDLYGKTKAVGEIRGAHALTLRSSFIGPELSFRTELLEWFLSQKGTVRGFKNAIYSGFTTLELSRIVEHILVHYPQASGLYNVSSEPISKYDLLILIRDKMQLATEIVPDEAMSCRRNLNSAKFRNEFGYTPPSWEQMIEELAKTGLKR